MPPLYPLAHRVIGQVNISAPEETPEYIKISRVLLMDAEDGHWIITECMAYDGQLTHEDTQAFSQVGDHYQDWKAVCDAFNAENFDPSEWEAPECICGQCKTEN